MLELLTDPVLLQAAEGLSDEAATEIAQIEGSSLASAAAAIAVGLAALGAGLAEKAIGAAAVGAMAEDPGMFGRGLLMTVIPETLVIFAIVVIFLV